MSLETGAKQCFAIPLSVWTKPRGKPVLFGRRVSNIESMTRWLTFKWPTCTCPLKCQMWLSSYSSERRNSRRRRHSITNTMVIFFSNRISRKKRSRNGTRSRKGRGAMPIVLCVWQRSTNMPSSLKRQPILLFKPAR